MLIQTTLPYLTKGTPVRCASERFVYTGMSVAADVREVDVSDTETAFEVPKRFALFADPKTNTNEFLPVASPWRMISFEGRLYAKLRYLGMDRNHFQEVPFSKRTDPKEPFSGWVISPVWGDSPNPLSETLRRQIEWDLDKASGVESQVITAWPNGPRPTKRHSLRNAALFPAVAATIGGMDAALHELSMRRIEAQAARMLVVGDALWVQCEPPSWRVTPDDEAVTLELATLVDGFDPVLPRRHFPLSGLEEAREYAARCSEAIKAKTGKCPVMETVLDYGNERPDLTSFDQDAMELRRLGYALASESMRYARKKPEWLGKIGETRSRTLFAAFAETEEADYILGSHGDIEPFVAELCSIWQSASRHTGWCELGPARAESGKMVIERALSLTDNTPITFGSGLIPSRTRSIQP